MSHASHLAPGFSLPIVGRYAANEIAIESDTHGLGLLADFIMTGAPDRRAGLLTTGVSADPYDGLIDEISTEESDGPVLILRESSLLRIRGGRQGLQILAENIRDLDEGNHLHIEYFVGHFYLGENSVPLVVHNEP